MKLLFDDARPAISFLRNVVRESRLIDVIANGQPSTAILRFILVWWVACVADADAADALNPKVDSYLKTYCLTCHGENATKSDF